MSIFVIFTKRSLACRLQLLSDLNYMRLEVFSVVKMSKLVFWAIKAYVLVDGYQDFGGP